MVQARHMLETHPQRSPYDAAALTACIAACFDCVQSCTTCADACLGEDDVDLLRRCIRLNVDCADICATTGRMLSRSMIPDLGLQRLMVQACAMVCGSCRAECQHHARMHEHCRICAEACRRCEDACTHLLAAMAAVEGEA